MWMTMKRPWDCHCTPLGCASAILPPCRHEDTNLQFRCATRYTPIPVRNRVTARPRVDTPNRPLNPIANQKGPRLPACPTTHQKPRPRAAPLASESDPPRLSGVVGRLDRGVQEPTDGDPCPEMTAEECFWGGGGIADNGGTAGGMAACTAYKYCTSCESTLNGDSGVCIKAYQSAYCKCSYFTQNGRTSCSSNGDCTYKG